MGKISKQNKLIIVFIGVYIMTAFFFLMFFSKDIDVKILAIGIPAVTGIFASIIAFIKYQNRKKK